MSVGLPLAVSLTILLSAALHASWNALLKAAPDKGATSVLLGVVSVPIALAAGWSLGHPTLPVAGVPWVLACALVEVLYFATLSLALHRLPLGTAYGLSRGVGLLLVWPLSHFLFGESLTQRDAAGIALLAGGLFTLARGASSGRGVLLAACCGASIALYPLSYKQALATGVDPYALFAASLGLSVPGQVLALGPSRLPRLRAAATLHPARTLLAGALCAGSFLIFLSILASHGPGRVTALRNASVVFAALFSMASGAERSWRDAACAVAVSVGCYLIAS